MDNPFNQWSVLLIMLLLGFPTGVRAESTDALLTRYCRADTPAETAIQVLVEETEAAGLPKATLNRLLAAGYREPAGSEKLRSILCAMLEAEDDGLPPGLLFAKLEEGLAKRVTLARILQVVRNKIEDLKFARSLLRDGSINLTDSPNVERLARVLSLSVARQEVTELFGAVFQAPTGMRVIAAEILGYGRVLGFDDQLLHQVIQAGLRHQAFTADWAFFIKVVTEARKSGIADRETASAAIQVLSEEGTLDELAGELGLNMRKLHRSMER